MEYGKIIKDYSVKLTSLSVIGYAIIFMSLIYFLNFMKVKSGFNEVLLALILGIVIGGFFLFFGNKKRTLTIYEKGVEFSESTVKFSSSFEDLALIKSFEEMGKTSSNLILMKENEEILSISSSFFKKEYLIEAFNLISKVKSDTTSIEDDLNWKQ